MMLMPGCRWTRHVDGAAGRRRACRTTPPFVVSSTLSSTVGHLLEPDRRALAIGDDDGLELRRVVQLAARLEVERLVRPEQLARRQVDVPVLQRLIDFVDADLLRVELLGIHLHAHGVPLRALHLHLRHAVDHRDARREDRSRRSRRAPTSTGVLDVRLSGMMS